MKYIVIGITILCFNTYIFSQQNKYLLESREKNKVNLIYREFSDKIDTSENFILNELNLDKKYNKLKLLKKSKTKSKCNKEIEHRKYQQFYNGIEVEDAFIFTHTKENKLISLHAKYHNINNLNCSSNISENEAFKNAIKHIVNANESLTNEDLIDNNKSNKLVILKDDKSSGYCLTYKFNILCTNRPLYNRIFVNAHTGSIIKEVELSTQVIGTGESYYSGTVSFFTEYTGTSGEEYHLFDDVRKIMTRNWNPVYHYYDNNNIWTASEMGSDQKAIDAFWAATVTHDYFMDVLETGLYLDDSNEDVNLYLNSTYTNNAFTISGTGMIHIGNNVLCDHLVSLDIIAHEMAHNLIYKKTGLWGGKTEESAVGEGLADIISLCTEHYNTDSNKDTWVMFDEACPVLSRNIRSPLNTQDPPCYNCDYFWDANWGNPHSKSVVISHWFYLFIEGGSTINPPCGNFHNITGTNNIAEGAEIVYAVIEDYLSSTPTYEDFKLHILDYLNTQYGGVSDETINAVQAFFAVNMPGDYTIKCWNELISGTKHIEVPGCKIDFSNTSINSAANVRIEADEITWGAGFEIMDNCNAEFVTEGYTNFGVLN